jgi:hypothetical protein
LLPDDFWPCISVCRHEEAQGFGIRKLFPPEADEESRISEFNDFHTEPPSRIALQQTIAWLHVPVEDRESMNVPEAHAHIFRPFFDVVILYLAPESHKIIDGLLAQLHDSVTTCRRE